MVYEQAGGYREAFYFAQDSDLWLRLGERGQIAYVPERLVEIHLDAGSISSRWRSVQTASASYRTSARDFGERERTRLRLSTRRGGCGRASRSPTRRRPARMANLWFVSVVFSRARTGGV